MRHFLVVLICLLCTTPIHAAERVDLNAASEEQLESLPGIGPVLAQRIVQFRQENGPFTSLDDLARLKGISPAVLEKLRELVMVGPRAEPELQELSVVRLPPPPAPAPDEVREVLEKFAREPSIRDVQELAGQYAQVHPEVIASWQRRVRVAAAAPQLRAEYRYVSSTTDRIRTGGGTPDYAQDDIGAQHRPLARAEWDLDRLVFNPDELRVSGEVADLVRLRASVLDQVTRLYFERRRLQVDLELNRPRDLASQMHKELRLQELVADIDALTGGFFSRALAERSARAK